MDDIQRQLELIDKQLRGRWDFHRELTGTAPLVFIAVGLISGICVQHYIPIGVWLWLLICACFFAAGAILFLIQRKNNHILLISMPYVALLCAVCLGGIRLINYKRAAPNDISHFVKDERTLATIRGVVISYPYTNYNKGWTFEKFS
ncbi:MAG: DUF4131 domain-containing protein, partial [Sedimentisphaerales bacterium]|nr:DUF4131 domain-containing protein [Sedimentisphaerales bacterium]